MEIIRKPPEGRGLKPNLRDYASARETFSWTNARSELEGLPGGAGLNIAHEAVDRHARGPQGTRIALRCLGRASLGNITRDVTYAELAAQSARFANALHTLGIGKGDAVFALLPRIPDSMDHLNFIVGLHKSTGIDVPEADYPQLATLDGCMAYLATRTSGE